MGWDKENRAKLKALRKELVTSAENKIPRLTPTQKRRARRQRAAAKALLETNRDTMPEEPKSLL